uniref:Hook microtubule-tethering protein 1 n=1 Tax=Salarias fasciatus TaxID=181472 RepID=A0A672GYV7_SALFA
MLSDTECPAKFLRDFQRKWREETGSAWNVNETTQCLFKVMVKKAMPQEVQKRLEGVVGLMKMEWPLFSEHVVHFVEQCRKEKQREDDLSKELTNKLTQLQLGELCKQKKEKAKIQTPVVTVNQEQGSNQVAVQQPNVRTPPALKMTKPHQDPAVDAVMSTLPPIHVHVNTREEAYRPAQGRGWPRLRGNMMRRGGGRNVESLKLSSWNKFISGFYVPLIDYIWTFFFTEVCVHSYRNCSDQVVTLEASMETYKRKPENLGDQKRQMKLLEENTLYMQNTKSLEKELRKANVARTQLKTYKRQLHKKLSEETRRADHLVFEMKRLEEKHETIMKEKERIIVERDSLKEMNEELRCTQAQQHQLSQAEWFVDVGFLCMFREKFINLQYENKMLRVQQKEHEQEKIAALQAQLEEAHKSCSELVTENRLGREQISKVQQQVEDLQKALQSQADKPDDSKLKRKLDAHMVQLNELLSTSHGFMFSALKLDELMAALKKKDDDMRVMEERYKMYLEKARTVIRALDPKLNPATAEIQALRIQLADQDAQILNLERQCEQARLREPEEKLIVTAWYNKSLSFQKLAMESRLGGCAASTSFLSQQHQVSNAPCQAPPINMPATSTSK